MPGMGPFSHSAPNPGQASRTTAPPRRTVRQGRRVAAVGPKDSGHATHAPIPLLRTPSEATDEQLREAPTRARGCPLSAMWRGMVQELPRLHLRTQAASLLHGVCDVRRRGAHLRAAPGDVQAPDEGAQAPVQSSIGRHRGGTGPRRRHRRDGRGRCADRRWQTVRKRLADALVGRQPAQLAALSRAPRRFAQSAIPASDCSPHLASAISARDLSLRSRRGDPLAVGRGRRR